MSLSDPISLARSAVHAADHTLTPASLAAIQQLTDLPDTELATPEYGSTEYLANCDATGSPVAPFQDLIAALSDQQDQPLPWISVVDDHVLVLRWLAHRLGIRHRAIHTFLDHPDHPDCTFIQIRSLSKYNQPGRFDMPVAGHVDGTDTPEQTARKEFAEELGLDPDRDLVDLSEIATYDIAIPDFQPHYDEVEHTTLYRATVNPEAIGRLKLQEGELAGLILFRKDELARWIQECPEQLGGGLIDSWKYYNG